MFSGDVVDDGEFYEIFSQLSFFGRFISHFEQKRNADILYQWTQKAKNPLELLRNIGKSIAKNSISIDYQDAHEQSGQVPSIPST